MRAVSARIRRNLGISWTCVSMILAESLWIIHVASKFGPWVLLQEPKEFCVLNLYNISSVLLWPRHPQKGHNWRSVMSLSLWPWNKSLMFPMWKKIFNRAATRQQVLNNKVSQLTDQSMNVHSLMNVVTIILVPLVVRILLFLVCKILV